MQTEQSAEVAPTDVPTLIYYGWPEDGISHVFDEFTAETGIEILFEVFDSQEQMVENLRTGETYDIVNIENQFIPQLINEGLLAEINLNNILNFKNVSPNFRDLTYDPGNLYTIPYSWGTTGLIVRTDLVSEPVTSWGDMWNPQYSGRVVGWESTPRHMFGATLRYLGYSANSENPEELQQALTLLLELRESGIWLTNEESSAAKIVSGEAVVALGWAYDIQLAQEALTTVDYVLPKEGALLWGDTLIIPENSQHKEAAELFLNFILRPNISGQIINANYYPMATMGNEEFVDPALLSDPVIFPPNESIKNAEILMPLTPEGEKLYQDLWQQVMDSGG